MDVFCDRLKLGSTAGLDCWTGQNKGRYHKKEFNSYSYSSCCVKGQGDRKDVVSVGGLLL